MDINIRKSAIKDSKTIAQKDKEKIYAKILELKDFPAVLNVKKLTNFEPAYRLRVGDYRILFDVTEDSIVVVEFCTEKKAINKSGRGANFSIVCPRGTVETVGRQKDACPPYETNVLVGNGQRNIMANFKIKIGIKPIKFFLFNPLF